MAKNLDLIFEAKKFLENLPLESVSINQGLKHIEVEGGTIDLEVYKCEKIEKVVFVTIKIHETGVSDETVIVWPDDTYNFPFFWCTLTVIPSVMNALILDFAPLMDFVVWPEYAEKYIQGINDLKIKASKILSDTIVDKAIDLPSLSVYTFSPYRIVANLSDEGVLRLPQVLNEYIPAYIKHWQQAEQITEDKKREFYLKKKEATRKLLKGNDPGYPIMVGIFGEEKTRKVFDIVF